MPITLCLFVHQMVLKQFDPNIFLMCGTRCFSKSVQQKMLRKWVFFIFHAFLAILCKGQKFDHFLFVQEWPVSSCLKWKENHDLAEDCQAAGKLRPKDLICLSKGCVIQSITKKHVPPVFQPYVFPVYLRNRFSYKKSIYIFVYQFLKSSQLEQKFFKSDDTIS